MIAYWWMTSWTRAVNVEAFAAFVPAIEPVTPLAVTEAAAEAATKPLVEAAAETIEPAIEAKVESVEPTMEAAAAPEPIAAVPQPEPVIEAVAAPEPALETVADDLTRMVGIGPKLAAALAERGVSSFAQIAAWAEHDLIEVDAALSLKGRAVREAWVAQAKRLAGGA